MDAECKCPHCGRDWVYDVPTGERRAKLLEGIDPAITASIPDWSTAKEWQAYKFPHSDLRMPAPVLCNDCWLPLTSHPPGVEIEYDEMGTGQSAIHGSSVVVRYDLFLSCGKEVSAGKATFTIGERKQVILGLNDKQVRGFEVGVAGIRVGGRRRFRVRPWVPRGEARMLGPVPPDETIIFHVELLAVESQMESDS